MRKFMKYRKTAVLTAMLLGISLFAAGCGGEGGKAGDSGAANTAETEKSDGTADTTEAAGSTESAGSEESTGTTESAGSGEAEGAGDAAANSQEGESAKEVSVQDIYKSVGESTELPSMVEGDDDFISNYYGIDPANLDSYVFASAEDATLATSVIIMKAKSEDAVAALESSLNTVKDQKAAEMQGYIPEQYDIVADSSVKTEGLYVYLVIAENAGDIEAVISAALQ